MNKNQNDHQLITLEIPMQKMQRHSWVNMPMPNAGAMARFAGWASGRLLFMTFTTSLSIIEAACHAIVKCCQCLKQGVALLTRYYDALPTMGMPQESVTLEASVPAKTFERELQAIDILTAIEGKHILIIGQTGSGKSTLAQWLASQSSSEIRVYDPDATPTEWQGLEVIGRGGDFDAINEAMGNDLVELERRAVLRGENGDGAIKNEVRIIVEEFPAIKDECPRSSDWLGKLARRGRKPRIFIVALAQSDTVTALGIEGDGVIRQNFCIVRLGRFSTSHAKKLKDDSLVSWLNGGKFRCLVDDDPCQLPVIPKQFPFVARNGLATDSEHPAEQDIQTETPHVTNELKNAVTALKASSWSDSKIIKEVLGCEGRRYQRGKELLNLLLRE